MRKFFGVLWVAILSVTLYMGVMFTGAFTYYVLVQPLTSPVFMVFWIVASIPVTLLLLCPVVKGVV